MITKYLIVFLISMVPLIELRGAIPYAVAFHISDASGLSDTPSSEICFRFRLFSCFARKVLDLGM